MGKRDTFNTYDYSLVICRNPSNGLFLAVNETKERGWWIPGVCVAPGESFKEAALRACASEGGVDVILKGIIKIDHTLHGTDQGKMRVIFLAEPADKNAAAKSEVDVFSAGSEWMTLA